MEMWWSLLCVASICLVVVECSHEVSKVKVKRQDNFRCCTPPQWTSTIRIDQASVTNGVNKFKETWTTVLYDFTNERVAYVNTTENSQPLAQRMIVDFKQQKWTIIVSNDNCVTYPLSQSMHFEKACTPENITFVVFAVAPVLSPLEGAFANTVYYNGSDVTDGHMTITVGDCSLIEEAQFNINSAGSFVATMYYFNQTLSVDDSMFVVPKKLYSWGYCGKRYRGMGVHSYASRPEGLNTVLGCVP